MTVPLIQGVLRYAHRADPNGGFQATTTSRSKERAEGWAFTKAVLP